MIQILYWCVYITRALPHHSVSCVADEELKQQLAQRQHAAEQRQMQLTKTTSLFDDEDEAVLERIFNSLTGKNDDTCATFGTTDGYLRVSCQCVCRV